MADDTWIEAIRGIDPIDSSDTALARARTVKFASGLDAAIVAGVLVVTPTGIAKVYDEGIEITQTAPLNFTGAGVSAAYNAGTGRIDVTITGGGGGALTAPVDPTDDGKIPIAAAGDFTYLGGAAGGNLLTWNGAAWVAGGCALGDTDAVSGTLAVGNGGTGLSVLGSANHVLKVNAGGTALEMSRIVEASITPLTITNASISNTAAIAGTKISPNFGSQDILTTGALKLGGTVSGTGDIRLTKTASIYGVNNAGTQNYAILALGAADDILTLGDATYGTGHVYQTNGDHTFKRGSATRLVVDSVATRVVSEAAAGDYGLIASQHTADTAPSVLLARKSRGSYASPSVVGSSDQLGVIGFSGYDGSAYQITAALSATVAGAVSAGNIPTQLDIAVGPATGSLATQLSVYTTEVALPKTNSVLRVGGAAGSGSGAGTGIAASTGTLRLPYAGTAYARNSTDAGDILLWDVGVAGANRVRFGDGSRVTVVDGSGLWLSISGSTKLTISSARVDYSLDEIRWGSGNAPKLYSVDVADATGAAFTGIAQNNNSATLTAGAMVLSSGQNANASALHGPVKLQIGQADFLTCKTDGTNSWIRLDGHETATTVGAAGGASALPATPTGYLRTDIGGTRFKIPYYAD